MKSDCIFATVIIDLLIVLRFLSTIKLIDCELFENFYIFPDLLLAVVEHLKI